LAGVRPEILRGACHEIETGQTRRQRKDLEKLDSGGACAKI